MHRSFITSCVLSYQLLQQLNPPPSGGTLAQVYEKVTVNPARYASPEGCAASEAIQVACAHHAKISSPLPCCSARQGGMRWLISLVASHVALDTGA